MKKLFILFLLLCAVSVQAQLVENARIERIQSSPSHDLKPAATPFSLLDFSRIKWSSSYSVGFFSGSNSSSSVGMLNTSVYYEFSPKLSLAMNIGIAHNPGAIWGDANNAATVLPSFLLNYQPSKNFSISVGMQTYQGRYGYGSNNSFGFNNGFGYGSGYGYGNPHYSPGYSHNSVFSDW